MTTRDREFDAVPQEIRAIREDLNNGALERERAIESEQDVLAPFFERCHRDPTKGIAISGGGIRSAAFALGALQYLDRKRKFAETGYLSMVSGGSFIGALVVHQFFRLAAAKKPTAPMLVEPARRAQPATAGEDVLDHLRRSASYLAPKGIRGPESYVESIAVYSLGLALNLAIIAAFVSGAIGVITVLSIFAGERAAATPTGAAVAFCCGLGVVGAVGWRERARRERERVLNLRYASARKRANRPLTGSMDSPGDTPVVSLVEPAEESGPASSARTREAQAQLGADVWRDDKDAEGHSRRLDVSWMLCFGILAVASLVLMWWSSRALVPLTQLYGATGILACGALIASAAPRRHNESQAAWACRLDELAGLTVRRLVLVSLASWVVYQLVPDGSARIGDAAALGCLLGLGFGLLIRTPHDDAEHLGHRPSAVDVETAERHGRRGRLRRALGCLSVAAGFLLLAHLGDAASTLDQTVASIEAHSAEIGAVLAATIPMVGGAIQALDLVSPLRRRLVRFVVYLLALIAACGALALGAVLAGSTYRHADAILGLFGPPHAGANWQALADALVGWLGLLPGIASRRELVGAGTVALASITVALMVIGVRRLFGIGLASLHYLYRDRLAEAFLFAENQHGGRSGLDVAIAEIHESCLAPDGYAGPFPIVATSVNLPARMSASHADAFTDLFELTPLYSGSQSTGFRRTADLSEGTVSLGQAMALSGAAIASRMGVYRHPTLWLITNVLNLSLGSYVSNPAHPDWARTPPRGTVRQRLSDTFVDGLVADLRSVYLSDGGHYDNSGIVSLVARRCKDIIAIDAEADPNGGLQGLADAIRICRLEFGVFIEVDASDAASLSGKAFAVGTIHYPGRADGAVAPGRLIYIKASKAMVGASPETHAYATHNPAFPHETTADQFFTNAQFESYRELGFITARKASKVLLGHDAPPNEPAA